MMHSNTNMGIANRVLSTTICVECVIGAPELAYTPPAMQKHFTTWLQN